MHKQWHLRMQDENQKRNLDLQAVLREWLGIFQPRHTPIILNSVIFYNLLHALSDVIFSNYYYLLCLKTLVTFFSLPLCVCVHTDTHTHTPFMQKRFQTHLFSCRIQFLPPCSYAYNMLCILFIVSLHASFFVSWKSSVLLLFIAVYEGRPFYFLLEFMYFNF